MKKGKKKKKGGGAFKVTVKSEDPAAEKAEMQMKKKILEDKYIIQKTKTNDAVRRLEEARTRFIEIGQFKENEKDKYKSIESDFVHQSVLIDKNFKEKLEELRKKKEDRDRRKKELNDELERMSEYKWRTQQLSGTVGVYNGTAFITEGSALGLGAGYSWCAGLKGGYYYCSGIGTATGHYFGGTHSGSVAILGTPLMIAARAGLKRIVKELLALGANPNVFIHVKNYDIQTSFGSEKRCPRSDTYLCALLDCYMSACGKADKKGGDEIAKILIEHGAGFVMYEDDYGRNMLWDVARVESPYLLNEMVKRGFDVNHEDNQGNTILHYCEGSGASQLFLRELYRLGVKREGGPGNGKQQRPNPTLVSQVTPSWTVSPAGQMPPSQTVQRDRKSVV